MNSTVYLPIPRILACSIAAILVSATTQAASPYTWTKNTAATQDWTTVANWSGSNADLGPGTDTDVVNFFADSTTALATGNNVITTNVPNLTLNTLTLRGKGAGATGATNITIGTSTTTWTLSGTAPTVNLNGIDGTQALNYVVGVNLALTQTTTLFVGDGTASYTFSGAISGSGAGLTKDGSSTLTLSGSNTYSGVTAINNGVLSISSSASLPGFSTNGAYSVASGAAITVGNSVTDADFGSIRGTTNFAAGSYVGFDTSAGARTYATALSGATGLIKTGANTLTLSVASTYSGGTIISAGTVAASNNASFGTGLVTVANGAALSVAGRTLANAFNIAGPVITSFSSSISMTGAIKLTGDASIKNTQNSTGVNFTATSAGTINLNGFTLTTQSRAAAATVNQDWALNGIISGSGASGLSITNSSTAGTPTATLALGGANTFTGQTLLNDPSFGTLTLKVSNLNALRNSTLNNGPASAKLNVTFNAGAGTYNMGGLAGSDDLAINGNTLSVGSNLATNSAPSFAGIITGTGGFTKTGTLVTQTLSGPSTYSGATAVDEGKLVVSGALNGTASVSVAAGATLASGSAGGSITTDGAASGNAINVTGTLSPGDTALAPITLTLAGTAKLNFNASSQLRLDVGATNSSDTVTFGTSGDWLNGSGNATLALNGTVDYASTYTVFSNVTTNGFTFASITGYDTANYQANFSNNGGSAYQLSFVAVPEPSALVALLGGLGMLVSRRRRPHPLQRC